MPMEVGDILQIVDNQTLFGQAVLNVYTYRVDINAADAYDELSVANLFNTEVIGDVIQMQTSALEHTTIQVNNLTQPLRFATTTSGEVGVLDGDTDDSFTAVGFRLDRSNKLTRNGQKRIAGVPQAYVAGNTFTAPYLSVANSVASKLKICLVIEVSGVEVLRFCPVITGKNTDGSYDLTRVQDVANVTVNPFVTSQVSRKQRL